MKLCNARVNFGGASQPRLGRKEPNMIIIGCDYHPGFQQIAFVDTDSGEWNERRLGHREEAEQFYRQLKVRGKKVRVGMEASGHARWFERLLSELQFELWIGDAAKIQELTRALEQEVEKRPVARRLMTHPGVGPLTALAFELEPRNALAAASRSPAMWGWCRGRNPVVIGDDWATSASKVTLCCAF